MCGFHNYVNNYHLVNEMTKLIDCKKQIYTYFKFKDIELSDIF